MTERGAGSSRPTAATEDARLVVGLQPVREAIRVHGSRLLVLLVERGASPRLEALARFGQDSGVPAIQRVERLELDRLSGGVQHQGTAAWAPPLHLLELVELFEEHRLILALDKIQDPQNFGAVLRSAVGVARAAVLWPEHATAPLSLATFRASAGAVEHAKLCRVRSLRAALLEAQDQGFSVVGLDAGAESSLRKLDLRGPLVLVLGSEHEGLSRSVRQQCTALARLPMADGVASLNASVAAALALYEAACQRGLT